MNGKSCGTGLNHSELGLQEYNKQYKTANKDKISENKKQYYTVNKEKLLEHMNQKITCECGCIVSRTNLPPHRKTKKHMKLMENK